MEKLKVSVCITTYNQVNYIGKCIESLVNQEVDFDFEILVSDDFSKDGTRDILRDYANRHPHLVKIFLQDKNVGPYDNFLFIHSKAIGSYVAHLDGDDYALPGKLKAQASFLDQNPNCNIVWHRMCSLEDEIFYEDNFDIIGLTSKRIDIIDLIANITVGLNSSKMYRGDFKNKDWTDYFELDFPFNVLKLTDPDSYASFASDEIYGVYRSNIGISLTQNYKIKIKIYKWLIRFYQDRLVNKSLINAKILLLLLSDIKHLKKTIFYGAYCFLLTIMSFRFGALKMIYSKKIASNNRFKVANIKV